MHHICKSAGNKCVWLWPILCDLSKLMEDQGQSMVVIKYYTITCLLLDCLMLPGSPPCFACLHVSMYIRQSNRKIEAILINLHKELELHSRFNHYKR